MWGKQRFGRCLHTLTLVFLHLEIRPPRANTCESRLELTLKLESSVHPGSGRLQLTPRTVRINYSCPKVLVLEVNFFPYGGSSWCIYCCFIPWYLITCYVWVILCNESPHWFSCLIWGKCIPSFLQMFPTSWSSSLEIHSIKFQYSLVFWNLPLKRSLGRRVTSKDQISKSYCY